MFVIEIAVRGGEPLNILSSSVEFRCIDSRLQTYNGCVGKLVTPADCNSVAKSTVGSSPTAPTIFK